MTHNFLQKGRIDMMKLGVNTVLFKPFSLLIAMQCISRAGYDGVELSAIEGMCEHLPLSDWKAFAPDVLHYAEDTQLKLLSMEVASLDETRLSWAFEAAQYLGIPVVNVGPGGKQGVENDLVESIKTLTKRAELAARYGVSLCCKAHVGAAIVDTSTTLRAMREIPLPSFGIDMDPSHIYRAGELPEIAIAAVLSRVKHIHIRDCKGLGPSPGEPKMQACGRGDINLYGYFGALTAAQYDGPVCLEVIGPDQSLEAACSIASESYGYMNACLKMLNAR